MSKTTTDRRAFLKTGALVAAPVAAAAVPAAALADDGTRARLARLEDERAIEALQRRVLARINGQDAGACGEFVARADAIRLEAGLQRIVEDASGESPIELDEAAGRARLSRACTVEIDSELAGHSTVEQMTRFQGHGSHRRVEARRLETEFVRAADGWKLTRLAVA